MFAKDYARFYDALNSTKPYRKEIEFIYKWAKRPDRILDIGCGTATYWKYYPKDILIYGVERSLEMIKHSPYKNRIYHLLDKKIPTTKVDLVTALFDVINYIPKHDWWKNLPLKKGGYFIFDIWDKQKVDRDGFKDTQRYIGDVFRVIRPLKYNGKFVDLRIDFWQADDVFHEDHRMYIYSHNDIKKFCGKEFEIVDVKPTKAWQTWYKLKRK